MSGDEIALGNLKNAITQIVQGSFADRKQVVFLSTVGQLLSKEGIDFKKLLGDVGLAEFIRSHMDDSVVLVSDPTNTKVLAAHPKSISLSDLDDPFGAKGRASRMGAQSERPARGRLHKLVWDAFNARIPDGQRRFLRPDGELAVFEGPDQPTEGFIEIPSNLVYENSEQPGPRVDTTYANVHQWCSDNSVEMDMLVAKATSEKPRKSLLDLLISNLTTEEASSVVLPLSVIAKLRAVRP